MRSAGTVDSPRILATAAAALALCAAGCGRPAPPPQAAATVPAELRRGLGAEPETLDPRLASDNASLTVAGDLYEGLTTEDATGRIVPGAAASWQVSTDGRAWTFVLRPGLQWSNGDALTAHHFAAGLAAVIAPGSVSPNAGLLDGVESVTAADDRTLSVRLRRPVPYLPALLALPVAAPLHPRVAAISNGTYRLVEWRRGQDLLLERNDRYNGAARVAIDRVRHVVVAELGTELNLFRTGELHVTSEVPNESLPRIRTTLPDSLRISPYLNTYAYAVNLRRVGDRDARRALAMAIDRERITSQVTGAGERPAYEWVAPGLPGYDGPHYTWRELPAAERIEAARAAWRTAAARGAAPERIVLCTDASANHRRTAVALADQWRTALGVETEIVELEWSVYLDTLDEPGQCDLVRFGWSADFADPEAFAAVFAGGHPQNRLGYASDRYDSLLAESRLASEPAHRLALLAAAEAQLLDDVPVIPLFHRVAKRLVSSEVGGQFANPLGHLPSRDLAWSHGADRN